MLEKKQKESGITITGIAGATTGMYLQDGEFSLEEKLKILTDAAKYDVACTSSGVDRKGDENHLGSAVQSGICHAFSSDGRCISLLKILMTNECIFDCRYCVNRRSNDVVRATFTPEEVCRLTIEFYRRNYIEGLFLSSGIIKSPAYTMEQIYQVVYLLRHQYHFQGYIHVKGIPGASAELIEKTGFLADRMSVNIELQTGDGLRKLAPNKKRKAILQPMRQIQRTRQVNHNDLMVYHHAPKFVPAGQSTQMIVGATKETDYQIVNVAEALYQNYELKRVFYSAYIDVNQQRIQENESRMEGIYGEWKKELRLPAAIGGGPPLLREHRLYQADWLMRYYGFQAKELLSEERPNFNVLLDPKCEWALRHLEFFPVEVNRADYLMLLRVPGIGVKSAKRIIAARQYAKLDFSNLKKMGVVLKRALYFITCQGKMMYHTKLEEDYITNHLIYNERPEQMQTNETMTFRQLSLFDTGRLE